VMKDMLTQLGYRDKPTLSPVWRATHVIRQRCEQADGFDAGCPNMTFGMVLCVQHWHRRLAEARVLAADLVLNHVAQNLVASSQAP